MAVPTIYRSDDASAPVLNGTAGSLITVLDACLVNGYGAKGAAGWTKPFTGTNKAAYRMATGGASRRMYLRVDDAGLATANVRGYDDMTDVDTGTEPFPTVGQVAAGLIVAKTNNTSNANARPWIILATGTQFYFYSYTNLSATLASPTNEIGEMFFGEYIYTPGGGFDYNVALISGTTSGSSNSARLFGTVPHNAVAAASGHYACRGYTNAAGAIQLSKFVVCGRYLSQNVMGVNHGLATPDPITGKVYFSRLQIMHPASPWTVVGHLPGLWIPQTDSLMGNQFDTINGSGSLAGKTFMMLQVYGDINSSNTNLQGRAAFETTSW
jgi:hypothetical protein